MRTPALKDAFDSLSMVNREFTYARFINAEFTIRITPEILNESKKLTSEVFPTNRYSKSFNWRLSEIEKKHLDYQKYQIKTFWVFTYAIVEEYFNACLALHLDLFKSSSRQKLEKEGYFEYVISIWKPEILNIDQEILTTLDFIRLSRNCLIHRDGEINKSLDELKRRKGTSLNRYWKAKVRSLNFKLFDPNEIMEDNLIELFTITRDCLRTVDSILLSGICQKDLIIMLRDCFNIKFPHHPNTHNDIVERRFATYRERVFNIPRG